uniref:PRELI/MSF1 domain-containing protein n=1 Tax=Palpitomonas bilix TaxID=652834 RepID=A0A7S3GL93_9EUKA
MVATVESSHRVEHEWDYVAQAHWQKYPHKMLTHVVRAEVLDRKVVDGKLHTKRIIVNHNPTPRWVQMIFPNSEYTFALEESVVDPATRELTMKTTNISMRSMSEVDEYLTYRVHPEHGDHTEMIAKTDITINAPYASKLEQMAVDRFGSNREKGLSVIQEVSNRIKNSHFRLDTVEAVQSNIVEDGPKPVAAIAQEQVAAGPFRQIVAATAAAKSSTGLSQSMRDKLINPTVWVASSSEASGKAKVEGEQSSAGESSSSSLLSSGVSFYMDYYNLARDALRSVNIIEETEKTLDEHLSAAADFLEGLNTGVINSFVSGIGRRSFEVFRPHIQRVLKTGV